jgi:hypothetical protein
MPNNNNDSAYEIGFCKPPKSKRFRKGVSGNPKGRPKGNRNVATVLAKALQEKVVINENGVRRSLTKLEAAVKQLVNKAAGGDLAALRQLTALAGSAIEHDADSSTNQLSPADLEMMEGLLERLEGCTRGEDNEK